MQFIEIYDVHSDKLVRELTLTIDILSLSDCQVELKDVGDSMKVHLLP